jgi:hypothetical protein
VRVVKAFVVRVEVLESVPPTAWPELPTSIGKFGAVPVIGVTIIPKIAIGDPPTATVATSLLHPRLERT